MKRFLTNPMTIVLLLIGTVLIGSNVCCTGRASNNEKNTTTLVDDKTMSSTVGITGSVTILTENTFDENIKTGVVLVDFWATWCPPCRMMGPVIENVGKEMAGKATICKLNIDQSPSIADRFGVQNIPTMIIFKDGKVAKQFVGITSKEDIITALNNLIK
jgi:thioredoxin 1